MVQEVSGRAPSGQALAVPAEPEVSALTGFDPSRELPQHLIDLGISAEQAANLHKLASYLLTLPEEYPDFEMDEYVRGVDSYSEVTVPECGTAACAAGHGPLAGIEPLTGENWESYADRAFAAKSDPWLWCFAGRWSDVDNTAHGAAKRILWLLDRGVPEDGAAQRIGRAPLCYLSQVSGQ